MKFINILFLLILISCTDPIAKFEFHSGGIDRSLSPITFNSDIILDKEMNYYLENIVDGQQYPVQFISDIELLTIIDHFPSNSIKVLELKKGDVNKSVFSNIKINDREDGIEVTLEGKPILFYQSQMVGPEGNYPHYYNRSGFIHPLYSPNGEILTDGFPKGHTHQNAIFNAWTNTSIRGKKVDFWNRQEELGTIKHMETISTQEGLVRSQIKTKLSHISFEHGEVLEEEWQIHVYPINEYYLFDLRSEQVNTSQDTLFLNEYLYGGMAFRGSKEWNSDDEDHFTDTWKIVTNKGLTNDTANHTRASWVDASGTINGQQTGLTVFGFPDNFRAPQKIRVHPQMPYWVFSPVIDGPFYIAPGQKYVSRYRYLSYAGTIDQMELNRIMADMEQPVVVKKIK